MGVIELWRVGLPAWIGGRKVVMWQHPKCVLSHSVAFECSPNALARCKATGQRFSKAQPRAVLIANGAKSYYQIEAFCSLIRPVLQLPTCQAWHPQDAAGFSQLHEQARDMVCAHTMDRKIHAA